MTIGYRNVIYYKVVVLIRNSDDRIRNCTYYEVVLPIRNSDDRIYRDDGQLGCLAAYFSFLFAHRRRGHPEYRIAKSARRTLYRCFFIKHLYQVSIYLS